MRVLLLVALAACRFGFTERTGTVDGQSDTTVTGDTPTDGSTTVACGTTSLLADDFAGTTASPQWYSYANAGGSVAQSGGDLVVTLQASQPVGYSGYDSSWTYDLRNSRVFVEVPQTTSVATHAQTDIQILGDNNEAFTILEEAGSLEAQKFVGAAQTMLGSTTYSPSQHRWWQIREAAGTLYFETSPDGVTYTQFATAPTPSWAFAVDVTLEAGAYQTETNPGSARFGQINGGTPSGTWCKASTQRDNFNSGTIGRDWASSYATNGCTYAEAGGNLTFTLASNKTQDCGLVTGAGYDLTGDAVFTALTTTPIANANIFTFLRASNLAGDNVEIALVGSTIVSAQNVGGTFTQLSTTTYSPTAHQYWQLAESNGTLSWQVSPDGATWTNLHSQAAPFSLVGVNLSIGTGTTANVTNPGSAVFSTFDQLPP